MQFDLEDELQYEARDMLLNADAYRGGALGLGSSEALAFLVALGYATSKSNLTVAGAKLARMAQHRYFTLGED